MPALKDLIAPRSQGVFQRMISPAMILLCGAALTIYLYFNALENNDKAIERRFEYATQVYEEALARTIDQKLNALRSIQTLFTFSEEVTRNEFEGASMLAVKQGVPAVEWVPIIRHEDRAAFEARAREYGMVNYSIKEFGPGRKFIPAQKYDEYYPILFVYPMQEFRDSLGLNIKNLPTRQEVKYAIRTSQPVSSIKLQLVQKNPRSDSWIISIPVYEAEYFMQEVNISNPHPPRGFLQALLYFDDVFTEAWGNLQYNHLHVSVIDITDKATPTPLWQDSCLDRGEVSFDALTRTTSFTALQREWQLTFMDTPELRDTIRTHVPFYTLVVGCALTCLLAALIYHILLIRHEVELQVQDRTHDLQIVNQQLNQEIKERRKSEFARTQLEERLRHSQKMEAIGTLAGGIAHDFNNILAAILGYIELVKDEVSDRKSVSANISELEKACFRARDLVRQILTFSRQKKEQREIIHPDTVLVEVVKLTRATAPVNVTIETDIDEAVSCIDADPSQIHQIAMNLITNASHAVAPNGGQIEVRLNDIVLEKPGEGLEGPIPTGRYVCLRVKDNGIGMDQEVINRMFEPYFTTKETGQGTGMGLSMVHGIVRSHGGYLLLQSTPGIGTQFEIYFPAQASKIKNRTSNQPAVQAENHHRIVVVDDEEPITSLVEINLTKNGYQVKAFTDSGRCLKYLESTDDPIDLLITDFAMPNVNGLEIVQAVRERMPDLPIIIYSGRITDEDLHHLEQEKVSAILRKPVSFSEMNQCIAQALTTN